MFGQQTALAGTSAVAPQSTASNRQRIAPLPRCSALQQPQQNVLSTSGSGLRVRRKEHFTSGWQQSPWPLLVHINGTLGSTMAVNLFQCYDDSALILD